VEEGLVQVADCTALGNLLAREDARQRAYPTMAMPTWVLRPVCGCVYRAPFIARHTACAGSLIIGE
jgi:hypothetical protein